MKPTMNTMLLLLLVLHALPATPGTPLKGKTGDEGDYSGENKSEFLSPQGKGKTADVDNGGNDYSSEDELDPELPPAMGKEKAAGSDYSAEGSEAFTPAVFPPMRRGKALPNIMSRLGKGKELVEDDIQPGDFSTEEPNSKEEQPRQPPMLKVLKGKVKGLTHAEAVKEESVAAESNAEGSQATRAGAANATTNEAADNNKSRENKAENNKAAGNGTLNKSQSPNMPLDIKTVEEGKKIVTNVLTNLQGLNNWLRGLVGYWDNQVKSNTAVADKVTESAKKSNTMDKKPNTNKNAEGPDAQLAAGNGTDAKVANKIDNLTMGGNRKDSEAGKDYDDAPDVGNKTDAMAGKGDDASVVGRNRTDTKPADYKEANAKPAGINIPKVPQASRVRAAEPKSDAVMAEAEYEDDNIKPEDLYE